MVEASCVVDYPALKKRGVPPRDLSIPEASFPKVGLTSGQNVAAAEISSNHTSFYYIISTDFTPFIWGSVSLAADP
jgi:hypothetical protein